MGEANLLPYKAAESTELPFSKRKTSLVTRMLVISTLVIFCLETILMVLFEHFWRIPEPLDLFLDGLVLVICLLPLIYYFIARPISGQREERHRINQELLNSNQLIERFYAIDDVLIAYLDRNFNFIRVNQAYASADRKRPEDFMGENHFDLYPNEENQRIFEAVVQTGKAYHFVEKPFEYVANPERGVSYWDWSLLPIKDSNDQVVALMMVLHDATSRKQTQLALVESERRFRAVFDQTFQHIGLLDPTGRILVLNQTALDFTGVREADARGQPLWQAPWWNPLLDDEESLQAVVQQASTGKIVRCERQVKSQTGEWATMDITLKPMLDEERQPVFLIYEARDVTAHVQSQEALKRSEAEINRLYRAEKKAHYLAETLRSAGLDLSRSLNSAQVLEVLLDHLFRVVPYTSAHLIRFEDADHLVVRLSRGEEDWADEEKLSGRWFDLGDLLFLQPLLEERRVLSVPDTMQNAEAYLFSNHDRVRSWLGMPLLAGNQVIGGCILEHTTPGFFTEEYLHWAHALIGQAAAAIQNAWLFEQVRDNRERLQALSRRLVEVQELERHYIARELHDEAGQALASLMVGLRMLERDGGDPQAVSAHCTALKQIADGVLENLHRLAIDLRPATLDHLGLVAALRQHAEMISDRYEIAVQFETVGKIDRLPGEIETAIYRIVQEALTNIVRHARATRAGVLLEQRDESLLLVVEDNGVGFDPQAPKVGQLGLLGMRERADMLGGTLTIESSPGQGTTLFLEVPCPSAS